MKAKQIDLAQGKILIGDSSSRGSASAYSLPAADGSANQVLETDGAGAVSWATPRVAEDHLLERVFTSSLK